MRHSKLAGLMTPMEMVARVAAQASSTAASAKTRQSGSISVTNADGTRTVLGAQNTTGTTMATHVGDTTPPGIPTGITAWSGDGAVHVAWDGTLTGGIPSDFCQVNLLVDGVAFASLNSAGSATYNGASIGTTAKVTATAEDDACAIDGTAAHNVSAACPAISVTVTDTAAATNNHFWWAADGVHISSTGDHDTSGFHQLMTSVKNAFMHGTTELMTISENLIELGKNSASSIIRMCGGKVAVSAVPDAKDRYTGILSGDYGAKIRSTNGNVSVCVDGFQDLISMVSGYLKFDDGINAPTQVSMKRFLTAIQPVVLYNGGAALDYDTAPGAGTTGTVTLSETAANFKELTIFGKYSVFVTSVTLTNPDGQGAALQLFIPNGAPATLTYVKSRIIVISGTHITNSGWVAMWLSATETHFDTTSAPEIAITRVEGRR